MISRYRGRPSFTAAWRRPWRLGGGLAGLLLLHASPLLACPVCLAATNARVLHTYYLTAVLLLLLPLAVLASIAGWLYRRFKESGTDSISTGDPALVTASASRPGAMKA